jgi:hypothetical protein
MSLELLGIKHLGQSKKGVIKLRSEFLTSLIIPRFAKKGDLFGNWTGIPEEPY